MKYITGRCSGMLLLALLIGASVQAQGVKAFPKPAGRVSDFEKVFTTAQVRELDSIIRRHEKETTNQIAIVTLDTVFQSMEEMDAYSLALARHWGAGTKEKNNGILIALGTKMKMIRIQNGTGLEKKLSDDETKEIIDHIILPAFKNGDYFEGIREALVVIMQEIR